MNLSKYRIILIFISILFFYFNVYSQGFYFGRNKIQYSTFDWHVLKTKHFDIYYYPEMQDIAEKGAKFAEDSYEILQTKFNHSVLRRIPLIFYSSHMHFQQTNITPGFIPEGVGGFFEFLKGRVVVPSNGDLNQFKKVIRHELVHVFMHSKIYRVLKNKGRMGSNYPAHWYVEGLAEYWSSEWDSQAEMVVRDAVLNGYMVTLENIWTIHNSFLMYKVGQNIMSYIADEYGEDKVLLLMENLWKHKKFKDTFRETIGLSYKEFSDKWLYHLQKKYYPLLDKNDFSSKVCPTIARDGYNFQPAYFDNNGKPYVVFTANRTGYSSIYMRPLTPLGVDEDENEEILIKGEKTSDFEAFHIFNSKIDVNKQGILTFGSKSGENDALYLFDIKERKIIQKYYFKNIVGILSPSWSPDGEKIAFTGLSFSGHKDIYIFNTRSEELTKLTNDFYNDFNPSWSPDGNHIVFSSDRTEHGKDWSYNVFLMNIHNGDISYITYGKQKDVSPKFSPDGKYIAFSSDRDLSLNIYLTEIDESYRPGKTYRITNFTNAAFDPEWIPGGDLLVAVYENRRFQIRYVRDIISNKKEVTEYAIDRIRKNSLPWNFDNLHAEEIERVQYETEYDLDIVQSQVSQDPIFGTSGGAQIALTDILGNDQYHILIYNNARTADEFLKSFNFAISKISLEHRTNYAYGIFRFARRYFNSYEDEYYYEQRTGGYFSLRYPLSKFTRLEYSSNYSYSDKEWIGGDRRFAVLASNYISFTKDNSVWVSSGPIEGQRISLTLGNTFDIKYSNVNFYTLMADYRQYFRLNLRTAYAMRFLYLRNQGREARRYYIGGSWDLRGYKLWSIRGRQVLFTSHELRFPFIDFLGIKFPFGGIGFNSVRGALFADAGNAWDSNRQDWLGSFGIGFRMRFIGFIVLRLDMGKKTNFKKIDDGIFTQFFFGWDF